MKGTVFDIQRFCINDGPGIRTTVFLKGCPLDCLWCHNPESKKLKPQLSFIKKHCILCGRCQEVCEYDVHEVTEKGHKIDYEKCVLCEKCVEACPAKALSIYGKEMNVEEVLSIVIKDKNYYDNSNGGLTISGGEAMSQFDFTFALAKSAKKREIHVTIETSGFGKSEDFDKIEPYIDLFLFDYKVTGNELHRKLTGVDRGLIDKNLNLLLYKGAKIILRCPIIPNYNLSHEHLESIYQLAKAHENIVMVEILPYHNLGESKVEQIGDGYAASEAYMPEEQEVEGWIKKLKEMGLQKIGRG
ncbi:glycyl-radical enzyme activating protein [Irregularibacter muris]|uniref:Glycyl-radical enzyme activating protein n=1 Tax=Irregularibacter muris TaxID=1796619 RepID=A0AAE3HGQ6_9FIRM|nr:glycyl-radical enzyme activating protein [Irregularibacter muris]MCR1899124.1 glycyl-radical enzyme activating protein [Irregularibacter muris]